MPSSVWVVEMYMEERERWEPTVGQQLTRNEARDEKRRWENSNPHDRFRLTRYVSTRAEGGKSRG